MPPGLAGVQIALLGYRAQMPFPVTLSIPLRQCRPAQTCARPPPSHAVDACTSSSRTRPVVWIGHLAAGATTQASPTTSFPTLALAPAPCWPAHGYRSEKRCNRWPTACDERQAEAQGESFVWAEPELQYFGFSSTVGSDVRMGEETSRKNSGTSYMGRWKCYGHGRGQLKYNGGFSRSAGQ